MWNPHAWINKGITSAQPTPAPNYSAAMAALAQRNTTTTPASTNRPGWNTVINASVCPFYIIPTPDHPRVPVGVYKTNSKPPSGLPPATAYPAAQQATCMSVPVPLGEDMVTSFEQFYGKTLQTPSPDTDKHLTIFDPWHNGGEYWDFEDFATLRTDGDTLSSIKTATFPPPPGVTGTYYGCTQAGYIADVEHGDGLFRALPDGSIPGAAASGIALAAGLITLEDIVGGEIKHALNLTINCELGHIRPASRQDAPAGKSGPTDLHGDISDAVPLGAMFRIDPTWVIPPVGDLISAHPELAQIGLGAKPNQRITGWHRFIWTAMQKYGFVTMDYSATVAFYTQHLDVLGTPYTTVTADQFTVAKNAMGYLNGDANPAGTAPWPLVQQVQYPF